MIKKLVTVALLSFVVLNVAPTANVDTANYVAPTTHDYISNM